MPPQMLSENNGNLSRATAFLLSELRRRNVEIHPVSRGWREQHGDAELEILWPPADLKIPQTNDTSLVLSIRVAGRRVLLNGDIQQQSISSLLDTGIDLRADTGPTWRIAP